MKNNSWKKYLTIILLGFLFVFGRSIPHLERRRAGNNLFRNGRLKNCFEKSILPKSNPVILAAALESTNSPIPRNTTLFWNPVSRHYRSVMNFTVATQRYIKLGTYFFLLYFFTVVYNVSNKKVLDALPLPYTVSALILLIGIPLFLPFWLIRPPVHLLQIDKFSHSLIALCHGVGHIATVFSLFAGSVSFTHVVKSAEPVFTALLSLLVTRKAMPFLSYLTLLPIVFGVAMASLKEFNFSWLSFWTAMLSNLCYQLRMVLSKKMLTQGTTGATKSGEKEEKKTLSAPNTFRVITILAFLQIFPIALLLEYSQILEYFGKYSIQLTERNYVLHHLLISGVSFYAYNEIAFWILDLVHPVTMAVGNTVKRVVIVIASILIFRIPVNTIGMIGSLIAILGSFLYALSQETAKDSISKLVNNNNSPVPHSSPIILDKKEKQETTTELLTNLKEFDI
jgi:solute carrier family 35 protein E1